MIVTLLNWIWAFVSFFLTGMLIRKAAGRITGWYMNRADETVVCGIVFCTVYAQIVSLFYKVGVLCTCMLFLVDLVCIMVCRKDLTDLFKSVRNTGVCRWKAFMCLLFGFFFLMAATLKVEHVDSYLYHAQAIEWNELYGAVKGLGNLHARLAYNSSFFCLQALFSLRGLTGRSLHVLNGLFCFLAVAYSFTSLKIFDTKKISASDTVRVITFLYVIYTASYISSPNSDILTLLFLIYILIKWTEIAEGRKDRVLEETAFLGVLSVYLVSLKLSAMPFVLLCLYPFYRFIKTGNLKGLAVMLLSGTIVIIPFFIRNVIISGYLLYPFPALDLFDPDWKIPASKAAYESREIMAWGRGLFLSEEYGLGFGVWIHRWWQYLESEFKFFILIDLAALIFDTVVLIKAVISKKADIKIFLMIVTVTAWTYWFFTAPIVRYGMPLMIMVPAVSMLFADRKVGICFATVTGFFTAVMLIGLVTKFDTYNCKIVFPEDYPLNEGKENKITSTTGEEFIIYTPVDNAELPEYPIYHQFPAVPLWENVKETEMRGKDFSEGFRYRKQENKN
ncbi:MAG: hypothetical protein K6F86_09900 [Lachnospiraceae bacterium]|nr:hypothetical protein [Lachnospiraceae bacterium]